MRCRPEDIVIYVGGGKLQGRIFQVHDLRDLCPHPVWNYSPEIRYDNGRILGLADHNLTPIRHQPGADESLSWCKVPTTKRLTEEEFKAAEVKWGEKV